MKWRGRHAGSMTAMLRPTSSLFISTKRPTVSNSSQLKQVLLTQNCCPTPRCPFCRKPYHLTNHKSGLGCCPAPQLPCHKDFEQHAGLNLRPQTDEICLSSPCG